MAYKTWKQIAWFIALWLASVACLTVVAFVIRLFL
ncbi:DUF2474 family protein [Paramylibacter ulvae]|nr:DUF2474 family protein [Amylibacter ulvae]